MSSERTVRSLFAVTVLASLSGCFRQNPVGELDTSFHGTGFVTHHNAAGGNGHDFGKAIAVDSQGRVVVAGRSKSASGIGFDMVVWRYTSIGGHDWSFGPPSSSPDGGFVVFNGAAGGNSDDEGSALVLDAQGRVLVAGSSRNSAGNFDMVVWRLQSNGTLDFSFGVGGVVVHGNAAGGNKDDRGNAMALDTDGRILVTGCSRAANGTDSMVVWRFHPDGTPDSTFGPNQLGFVLAASPVGGSASGNAILVDGNGLIIVAGAKSGSNGNVDMALWRFQATGTADAQFGLSGLATHNSAAGGNNADIGRGVVVDLAGRLVVTGDSRNAQGNSDMAVWRYKANGTLDPTFHGTGFFVHNGAAGGNSYDSGNALVLDKQGRILVAGASRKSATGNFEMVIWGLKPDGTLDGAFGPGGKGYSVHGGAAGGTNGDDFGEAVALDSQDRLLVAGESYSPSTFDMAVWRYK